MLFLPPIDSVAERNASYADMPPRTCARISQWLPKPENSPSVPIPTLPPAWTTFAAPAASTHENV